MVRGRVHRYLFLLSLTLFVTGIPFCRPLMSFGLILLSANWLAEGGLSVKLRKAVQNKVLWAVLLLYLLHVAGLCCTRNWEYALNDLLIKIPLLALPLIFSTTKPLDRREYGALLRIYLCAVGGSALIGLLHFHLHPELTDKRHIAWHISYIRFGLNLCFSYFVAMHCYAEGKRQHRKHNWIYPAFALCMLGMMIYMGAMTALLLGALTAAAMLLVWTFRKKHSPARYLVPAFLGGGLLAAAVLLTLSVRQYTHADYDIPPTGTLTADGHPYADSLEKPYIENGQYVYAFLCEEELKEAWQQRSSLPYDGLTKDGDHTVRNTLIRYLNSKGLRKDRAGLEGLDSNDIQFIENGLANVNYTKDNGFRKRYYESLWETIIYLKYKEELGSVPQRMEAWKASIRQIACHPLFGVGTGDVKDVFLEELQQTGSPIDGILVRSHNQYLSFAIAFGWVGLAVCLFSLLYPPIATRKRRARNPLYLAFLLIFLLSMLTDDPLERQDGVTLFAFFNSLFLFLSPNDKK